MFERRSLRVFVVEGDIYARQAIASYLSWDRRTRVIGKVGLPEEMIIYLRGYSEAFTLDAVTLDAGLAETPQALEQIIGIIHLQMPETDVVVLASVPDATMALAACRAGARAFLVREQVGFGISSAVRFAHCHPFVVTQDVALMMGYGVPGWATEITVLPERRHYARLTRRIEQALWLCVVEGLPAELAAEEMGVSVSTVRSYIKEGYRILEAEDETTYPPTFSPAERAFLRFTALETTETHLVAAGHLN